MKSTSRKVQSEEIGPKEQFGAEYDEIYPDKFMGESRIPSRSVEEVMGSRFSIFSPISQENKIVLKND